MKTFIGVCSTLGLLVSTTACKQRSESSDVKIAQAILDDYNISGFAQKLNATSLKMYQTMVKEQKAPRNDLLSPFSALSVLGMLRQGADDTLAQEMDGVLGFDGKTGPAFAVLGKALTDGGSSEAFKINLANRISVGDGINADFKRAINRNFTAGSDPEDSDSIKTVDFTDPEKQRAAINQWILKQTNNKIKDLIPPGLINTETHMVLANAIHVKGLWANDFLEPSNDDFFLQGNKKIEVPTLHQGHAGKYGTYTDPKKIFSAIDMTTKSDAGNYSLSMVVLLPAAEKTLPDLEAYLSPEILEEVFKKTAVATDAYQVSMPAWTLETARYDLKEICDKMGLKKIFSGNAGLVKAFDAEADQRHGIDSFVQKTFMDVNPVGFEAAGASAGIFSRGASKKFKINRPFMYLIKDNRTNTILFIGRVVDPRVSNN